ncbi:molybdopterin-dependent oxidoreductase [uncultured Adlercreutzia sp.]|uniref:molybdopterin-dependent oxidoreductase n=1 Tax=uncultured Adlercreutzia sp. TaxID=875803 RepID=UPI0026773864|nr:molybdopterin-dependent oxidoreductase [uncultured Adlercreutzia sp.]
MSEAKCSTGGLTRRSFLKTTGAAAAGLGVAGATGLALGTATLAPTSAHAEGEERTAHLCHQFHCLTGCTLKCVIRDEKVAIIEPSDLVDKRHSTICLRGINEVNHIYSQDRLKVPLKRVGERGEGKFEEISWDEAIKTIADNLKAAQQKYGEDSVFIRKATEASIGLDFIGKLLKADSGGLHGIDNGWANGIAPAFGPDLAAASPRSHWEFKDASTIIELSHNPLESAIIWSAPLMDAKEAGVYIVCIDPRFTPTAAKADEWLPVRPGTDAAIIQAMIKAIVENNWYDEEFVMAHTSCPYLVDRDTGKSFRSAEVVTPNPTVVGEEVVGAPFVWDTITDGPTLYDDPAAVPALEGEWEFEGKKLVTEFTLIKEWVSTISYDWAEKTSGIEAQTIVNLADRYANNGPAIIDYGLGGVDKYTNSDVTGHAAAILVALTGNYGKRGAGFASYVGFGSSDPFATLNSWELPEEYQEVESPIAMYDMPYQENKIRAALTFGDAFTLQAASANDMLNWVKSLDFYAIVDIYHSSAVDYADIVLPACTKFECEESVKQLRDSRGYVTLANGMVKPMFESKSDLQIERLLAAQWGLEDLLPKTYEELARRCLEGVADLDPRMEGFTYEALLSNGGVMKLPETGDDYMPDGGVEQIYPTPTTRIELYYEYLTEFGQALPVYEDANEAYESNPKKEQFPLYFTQGKSRYRIHAYYSASEWFQEDFGPRINIAPEDAEARGIVTGDDVRVYNDRGSFVATALVNRSLQPGVLFMAETTYTRYYKDGFLQNVTNSVRPERGYALFHGPQIPYNDTLVQVEKA